jgi:Core-2/I-Branching enzyme
LATTDQTMRIACILMAHKGPQQIERFINKFSGLPFDFYLHIDKKIEIEPFEYISRMPQVYLIIKRVSVRWASYSYIVALLNSLKQVLESGIRYDFISIMSGQDYPIKPVMDIYYTLEKNPGRNFICYDEGSEWWGHAISRVSKYHFTNFSFRGRYRIQFLVNALLPERKFPLPYQLYGGPRAMCMTLSSECADFVLSFIESDKRLRRFIRFTWGPDEFIIPTIIMNSNFKQSVVNNNFYYIDWSKGGVNPKTLRTDDYDLLLASDKLLARKFDIMEDSVILDMLDKKD